MGEKDAKNKVDFVLSLGTRRVFFRPRCCMLYGAASSTFVPPLTAGVDPPISVGALGILEEAGKMMALANFRGISDSISI